MLLSDEAFFVLPVGFLKKVLALLAVSLFLLGCVQQPGAPTPSPTVPVIVPSPTPVKIPSPVASPVANPPAAVAEGFNFKITGLRYAGNQINFTFSGVKGGVVYVVGVSVEETPGRLKPVRVEKGGSGRVTASNLPYCGEPGARFKDVGMVVVFNQFSGILGQFDAGSISGICG